jgi:hypothetical protein
MAAREPMAHCLIVSETQSPASGLGIQNTQDNYHIRRLAIRSRKHRLRHGPRRLSNRR